MTQVAIASSSQLSAEAGKRIADEGGNAVDAAIAASLVSMTTEPGVCSLGGGGFVTVSAPGEVPITIDGSIAMPGRGLDPEQLGHGVRDALMGYGGGLRTIVGHGSVGVPGALAALGLASERYGRLPWHALVQPAYELARDGFPLLQPSHDYLIHSHEVVFGWHPLSREALHHPDGGLKGRGERILVRDLGDSLDRIARFGAQDFYTGEIAALIARDSRANEGMLTAQDLAAYEPVVRTPLRLSLGDWDIATNPPPAIGGTTLSAMLIAVGKGNLRGLDAKSIAELVDIQRSVFAYRRRSLDKSDQIDADARALLDMAHEGALPPVAPSSSTVHASAVDDERGACAITMSAGYSAGVIPPGTGIWMNNCLGEIELNRRGLIAGPPGTRISSNMAPTVAMHQGGEVLAIGSPGADRITSAILQTLINFVYREQSLRESIDAPRLHTEVSEDGDEQVAVEPGIDASAVSIPVRSFEERSMFFGGVGATLLRRDGTLEAAADPRRTGGAAQGGLAGA